MPSKLLNEFKRNAPSIAIIGIACLALGGFSQIVVQLYILSMSALVVIATHIIRKSLFPYFDLAKFANKSLENPIASSIVCFGMLIFMSVIVFVTVAK